MCPLLFLMSQDHCSAVLVQSGHVIISLYTKMKQLSRSLLLGSSGSPYIFHLIFWPMSLFGLLLATSIRPSYHHRCLQLGFLHSLLRIFVFHKLVAMVAWAHVGSISLCLFKRLLVDYAKGSIIVIWECNGGWVNYYT